MTNSWRRWLSPLAVCLLVLTSSWPPSAHAAAADAPKFTIRPAEGSASFFTVEAAPGEVRDLPVLLANAGTALASARTYAADAYTTVNGGLGAKLWDDPKTEPTTWVQFPNEVLEIGPKVEVRRSATVTVPLSATPGQHLTSLVIENAELFDSEGAEAQQRLRQVIAVLIEIPGRRTPALEIGSGRHTVLGKQSVVVVALSNTGNVLLKPRGSLAVLDSEGDEVARAPVQFGSLYAGDAADLEVPLASALQVGTYTAALTLSDEATGATARREVPFDVTADDTAKAASGATPDFPDVKQTPTSAPVDSGRGSDGAIWPLLLAAVLGTALLVGGIAAALARRGRRAPAQE